MKAHISVVIPAFRAERYLGAAIESVLSQTLPVSEVIVVDDGSPDATAEVAKGYGNRGVRVLLQANAGAAAARNAGVAAVSGTWLAFLDADDLWPEDKLERQWRAAGSEGAGEMIFGQLEQFHSPELTADERARIRGDGVTGAALFASAMLLRTANFHRAGPFMAGLRVGEFLEWYQRASDAGLKSTVLDNVVLRRRLHLDNLTRRTVDRRAYLQALKAGLDRRRASGEEAGR